MEQEQNNIIYVQADLDRLIEKYPAIKETIEKEVNNSLQYFREHPFDSKYHRVFLRNIKDSINLINLNGSEDREKEHLKLILREVYEDIIKVLKEYLDIREDYYPLVSLWIIGTYLHDSFETYPYLFINAMRGSGKTRLLKLIKAMSKNGDLVTSLKESVLFRTAKGSTLCIDEFESIASKENQALRELLNACYKKGMKVKRMKKGKVEGREEYVVEEFEPYTPIAMANIWGMDEVLGDRAITMILEKSANLYFNLIMEDFVELSTIKDIKSRLEVQLVQLVQLFGENNYTKKWNNYIKQRYNYITTLTTLTTLTTETTLKTLPETELLEFFNTIHDSGINGRNLELFFPLFLIAKFIGDEVFATIATIGKEITKERREDEMVESRDVSFIDFVAQQGMSGRDFISIRKITNEFRNYLGDQEGEDRWINPKWVGKALKRLSLITDKRRLGEGIEIIINVDKAIEKLKLFRKK